MVKEDFAETDTFIITAGTALNRRSGLSFQYVIDKLDEIESVKLSREQAVELYTKLSEAIQTTYNTFVQTLKTNAPQPSDTK